ncbi:hypothetical protein B0H17DRAFT_1214148 [Mycena rosella]|uniref:RING-type domain-containing protein n=1 Tax=Mycena rosella TaxID=1033263 RepID=A0AAD7CNM2_MYCRO|nr:hypothetical protein B0H17DRAFT_1214148 [Mycena rosella]
MRAGSRLLSGASMENSSMLYEHTLLTSGDVADAGAVYSGWPAKQIDGPWDEKYPEDIGLVCPICHVVPQGMAVTPGGHLFCESCIKGAVSEHQKCPLCSAPAAMTNCVKVHPSSMA